MKIKTLEFQACCREVEAQRVEEERKNKMQETSRLEDLLTKTLNRVNDLENAMEKKEKEKQPEKETAVDGKSHKKHAPAPSTTPSEMVAEEARDDDDDDSESDGENTYLTTPDGTTVPLIISTPCGVMFVICPSVFLRIVNHQH